ncbi:MAG: exopolysaccharide biosynthesis polyprenyl glycosylphosphotransferase, partial [Halobacteriovoraceae bacterium]|nr:exopolysaccharide biosynthesis polyprenyl glycosylphosphotransferase [Halobacteriovoraceae bacterium]
MNRAIKKLNYQNRIVDSLIILISWMLAYYLRFILEFGGDTQEMVFNRYLGYGFLLTIISVITFKNTKVYETTQFDSTAKELRNVFKANLISFVLFLVVSFFSSQERLSRIMLVFYLLTSSSILVLVKIYFRNSLLKLPVNLALVGHGESIKKYYEIIKEYSNYKLLFWFDAPDSYAKKNSVSDFDPKILEENNCDGVIIGFDTKEANLAQTYIEKLSKYIIPIMVLPDVEYAKLGFSIYNFKGIPVLSINEPNVKSSGLLLKRIFDFLACGIGFLLISPLLVAIALLIKLTSKGPVFYAQTRMGVDGKEFKMWKFRSMVVGEKNQEGWTVKDDPRVTGIGQFIRKTSFDELPQLWNVLAGDMSLVGPRPERPVF